MTWLTIDGSYGEGGGQLTRYALSLAAITGRPLHLMNIRAKRPKPGLMAQHLTALKAVAAVSGGVLEGAELGKTEIRFRPGRIISGEFRFTVGTAGSIALVLQALLPLLCVPMATHVSPSPAAPTSGWPLRWITCASCSCPGLSAWGLR